MDGPLVIMIMPFLFSGAIRYLSCVITFFKKKTTYITLHYQSIVRYGNLDTWINLPRLYPPRFYQPRYKCGTGAWILGYI